MKLKLLDLIALVLVIIGGLNWGLIGLSNLNIVEKLLGAGTAAQIIYTLVGIASLYLLLAINKIGRKNF
jgi:hypothetical protein